MIANIFCEKCFPNKMLLLRITSCFHKLRINVKTGYSSTINKKNIQLLKYQFIRFTYFMYDVSVTCLNWNT